MFLPALYMNNNNFYHTNYMGDEAMYPIPNPIAPAKKPQIGSSSRGGGFNIGVTPGAVVGALVGGSIAKNQVRKSEEKRLMANRLRAEKEGPSIEGNYYKQVESVANNLKMIFTPVSAIFVIQNGKKEFTLDTIENSEMNHDMKNAWKNKDENYFKSLMMSKMYSEMQIAEQGFAKQFARKQLGMKDMITKDASDTSFIDDMSAVDSISYGFKIASLFNDGDVREKIACSMIEDMENEFPSYEISPCLDRPFDKYAGVISGITSSLGIANKREDFNFVKKKLEDPSYTMKNIKIGFLPDRVIFSLGNQLVSTLPLTGMNEEGYNHFLEQNAKYFKSYFASNVKENMSKKSSVTTTSVMDKTASDNIDLPEENDAVHCLLSSDAHPVSIYLVLCQRFGLEWLTYDIVVIEDIVKSEFGIDDMPESNINKIAAILMINQSDNPFINSYAFEKTVLSLCSRPVDFMASESEFIRVQDIVFAIDIMDRVTPFDDIYDNFSKEALNYMANVLSEQELYVYNPRNIIGSDLEPGFNEVLNELLIRRIKDKMSSASESSEMTDDIFAKCEYIADNALGILKSLRRMINENPNVDEVNKGDLVDAIITKKGIREDLSYIIKKQVIRNFALDDILSFYEDMLKHQLEQYNISRPEKEGIIND